MAACHFFIAQIKREKENKNPLFTDVKMFVKYEVVFLVSVFYAYLEVLSYLFKKLIWFYMLGSVLTLLAH